MTIKQKDFWIATIIVIVTVILMALIILRWVRIGFTVGPFRMSHIFVWIGTVYVAFAVPIIAYLKKHFPPKYSKLYSIHVFGNLIAFLLISLHFASQISRPADSYPPLGTGIILYAAMVILVSTGFLQRYHLLPKMQPPQFKFVHFGSAFAFYLIILVHILHGFGIL